MLEKAIAIVSASLVLHDVLRGGLALFRPASLLLRERQLFLPDSKLRSFSRWTERMAILGKDGHFLLVGSDLAGLCVHANKERLGQGPVFPAHLGILQRRLLGWVSGLRSLPVQELVTPEARFAMPWLSNGPPQRSPRRGGVSDTRELTPIAL